MRGLSRQSLSVRVCQIIQIIGVDSESKVMNLRKASITTERVQVVSHSPPNNRTSSLLKADEYSRVKEQDDSKETENREHRQWPVTNNPNDEIVQVQIHFSRR